MTFIGVIAAFTLVVAVMGNPKPENDVGAKIGTSPTTAGEESGHLDEEGIMSRDISDLKGLRRDLGTALAPTPWSCVRAPKSNTANNDNHYKINLWGFSFLYEYGASLKGSSGRRSSAMNDTRNRKQKYC